MTKNYENLELSCHRLKNGKSTVIGVREYVLGESAHSNRFKKLTVVLPENIQKEETYRLNENVKAFYSYGLTYGLGKVGCFGAATDGTIAILEVDANLVKLKIELSFDMKSPLGWKDRCTTEKYSETVTANAKKFELLTPWDGLFDEKAMGIDEARPPRDRD